MCVLDGEEVVHLLRRGFGELKAATNIARIAQNVERKKKRYNIVLRA